MPPCPEPASSPPEASAAWRDIAALASRGFEAAITGRALYEGAFSLPEALAAAAAGTAPGDGAPRADGS